MGAALGEGSGSGRACSGGRQDEPEQKEAAHGRVTLAALCDGAVNAWS